MHTGRVMIAGALVGFTTLSWANGWDDVVWMTSANEVTDLRASINGEFITDQRRHDSSRISVV